jgi:CBS domain containing-hemolysin-like protein
LICRDQGAVVRLVDDEAGNVAGLLFLEDVIEVLVGEVDATTTRRRP